jgi:hypothetical protein
VCRKAEKLAALRLQAVERLLQLASTDCVLCAARGGRCPACTAFTRRLTVPLGG